jgi:hypothetical protein
MALSACAAVSAGTDRGRLNVGDITLDYLCAIEGQPRHLTNLSAVVAYGEYLRTASDKGRTIECLKRDGAGYRLHDQIMLDDLCKELPKGPDPETDKLAEADIESLSICGDKLWVCGFALSRSCLHETTGRLPAGQSQFRSCELGRARYSRGGLWFGFWP